MPPPPSLHLDPTCAISHALLILNSRRQRPFEVVAATGPPQLGDERALLDLAQQVDPAFSPATEAHQGWLEAATQLVNGATEIGQEDDQGRYEAKYAAWAEKVAAVETHLTESRFLCGAEPTFADLVLFAFAVRVDAVYFALFKANPFLLEDLPALHAFARDLYERPEVHENTDPDAIVDAAYSAHAELNPGALVPVGGRPDLDAPHERASLSRQRTDTSTEEDQGAPRASGEWVRGLSNQRGWIGSDEFPAEPGRYHLFAPYNCPWSHRALLARSVKGLQELVGASVVYFRRHPTRGWQLNAAIEGCDDDPLHGRRFVIEYYEQVGSKEKSVPLLVDAKTDRIVNNESAEILRMFDTAFGEQAGRSVQLYPEGARGEIDAINELVYQRINNGAYKAGFARSQHAYERAFHRYFAALRWVDSRLAERRWLAATSEPSEADLRLFPTVFRHDAVYYARFRLNAARVRDFPHIEAWLARMMDWPGVADASNLDHARNGYFGRSGNEIVPAGPVPLGLSSSAYPRDVWLGDAPR